jgi:hypothetical protein
MQYTLRDIPPAVDAELRRLAKAEGKSLNTVAIEALTRGVGLGETTLRQRGLSNIAGTWQEDPEFDQAIAEQDQIDERMGETTEGSFPMFTVSSGAKPITRELVQRALEES